jgi:hypothetical protein
MAGKLAGKSGVTLVVNEFEDIDLPGLCLEIFWTPAGDALEREA